MGVWGTAIFSDDLAADVRESFRDYIGDGLSPAAATTKLTDEFASSLSDQDEAPVFWLALASTQWDLGLVLPDVCDKAFHIIEYGDDLNRWQHDKSAYKKRGLVLEKLRQKLMSPPPISKKAAKRFRDTTNWEIGQIIGYQLLNGQKCFFRIIGFHSDKGGKSPVAELIDWIGTDVPSIDILKSCSIRRHRYQNGKVGVSQFLLGSTSERDFPKSRIIETGYSLPPKQRIGEYTCFLWRFLDQQLNEYFQLGN